MLEAIHSNWKIGLGLLCTYGFFVEMKPSEPYLTPYLVETKHFENDLVNNHIYPYWTYGQLVFLFLIPLMTQLGVHAKTMIYMETIGFLLTRVLLIWGISLRQMQWMQLTCALGSSTKAIYFSYVYLILDGKEHYQMATSYIWAANALGISLSGIVGQILVNYGISYLALNYISMMSVIIALVFAIFIPTSEQSRSFTDEEGSDAELLLGDQDRYLDETASLNKTDGVEVYDKSVTWKEIIKDDNKSWWQIVLSEYTMVLRLFQDKRGPMAITWIMTKCCEDLVQNYVSNLWYTISDDDPTFYGGAFALYQGVGVCAACLPVLLEYCRVDNLLHRGIQQVASLGLVISLLIMTMTNQLFVAYLAYVTFGMCFYIFMTSTSCTMASSTNPQEQVMLFATNLFFAVLIETIITAVLSSSSSGDGSSARTWFAVITCVQGTTVPVYFYQSYQTTTRKM